MIKITIDESDLLGSNYKQIEVDPHEALKALEEQAPEVLKEWAGNPWHKVSDDPPPKDGSEFLYCEKTDNGKWIYQIFAWIECGEMWVTGYGYENTRDELEPDGEWMPVPK